MKRDVAQAIRSVEPGSEPDSFKAILVCDPSLRVFEGHFPGNPIVPGVMELEMLRTVYERFTGQRWAIARVIKAKFTNRILPGDIVTIEGAKEPTKGPKGTRGTQDASARVKAAFRRDADAVQLARIVVVLRPG